jgi:hypothetical protein
VKVVVPHPVRLAAQLPRQRDGRDRRAQLYEPACRNGAVRVEAVADPVAIPHRVGPAAGPRVTHNEDRRRARELEMRDLSAVVDVIMLGDAALTFAGLYLLPVMIAWIRRCPGTRSVAAVNVLLGWTLIGWVAALAMALRPAGAATAARQVVQNLPGPPQPLGPPVPRCWAGRRGPYPHRDGSPPPLELPPRPADSGVAG